jgi:hypothetical protein
MKNSALLHSSLAALFAVVVSPAFGNTMSVPNDSHPAYSVEIPSDWKPSVKNETVEATEPDNHVFVSGWTVTSADLKDLEKDLAGLLKDSMKSIEGEPKDETIENNGIKFMVLRGSGVDKREGNKVKFMVAIFDAGGGKAGIFYADWDTDAPADTTEKLNGLMNSIKLAK